MIHRPLTIPSAAGGGQAPPWNHDGGHGRIAPPLGSANKVAYGLSIDTDLDDLECRNSPYFAFFYHRIR